MNKFPSQIKSYALVPQEITSELEPYIDEPWNKNRSIHKDFKKTINKLMLVNQQAHCAFCGTDIGLKRSEGFDIEHVAPKKLYPQWTYEPKNLVLACERCNRYLKRGFDTIIPPLKECCSNCEYNIIHPLYEEFNDYIDWEIDSYPIIKETLDSKSKGKAKTTIDLFKLTEDALICERAYNDSLRQSIKDEDRLAYIAEMISFI